MFIYFLLIKTALNVSSYGGWAADQTEGQVWNTELSNNSQWFKDTFKSFCHPKVPKKNPKNFAETVAPLSLNGRMGGASPLWSCQSCLLKELLYTYWTSLPHSSDQKHGVWGFIGSWMHCCFPWGSWKGHSTVTGPFWVECVVKFSNSSFFLFLFFKVVTSLSHPAVTISP